MIDLVQKHIYTLISIDAKYDNESNKKCTLRCALSKPVTKKVPRPTPNLNSDGYH